MEEILLKISEKYVHLVRNLKNTVLKNKPEDDPVSDAFHELQLGLGFLQGFNWLAAVLQVLNLFAQLPDFESDFFICCKLFS